MINHGVAAGASIEHPHAQIVALDLVPPAGRAGGRTVRGRGSPTWSSPTSTGLGTAFASSTGRSRPGVLRPGSAPYELRLALPLPGSRFDEAGDGDMRALAGRDPFGTGAPRRRHGRRAVQPVVHTAPPGARRVVSLVRRGPGPAGDRRRVRAGHRHPREHRPARARGNGAAHRPAAKRPSYRPTNFALPGPCSRKLRTPVSASSVPNTSAERLGLEVEPVVEAAVEAAVDDDLRHAHGDDRPRRTTPPTPTQRPRARRRGRPRSTSPMARASSALTCRPLQMSSFARARPDEPWQSLCRPSPGITPSSVSGCPDAQLSAAMRRSHASASSRPPPSATPLIAAMTGRGSLPRAPYSSPKPRADGAPRSGLRTR